MRFYPFFATLATLSGLMAGGLAAPGSAKRSVSVGRAYTIITDLTKEVQAVTQNVTQTLVGISPSSPASQRESAAEVIADEINGLTAAVDQFFKDLTAPKRDVNQKRQATPPDPSTGDLINAISALVTQIGGLITGVIKALGADATILGPATAFITTVSNLIVGIAAVVVDFLPFLPAIASILSAVGDLLTGIGGLIPGM